MQHASHAVSLSLSVVALAIAGFSIVGSGPDDRDLTRDVDRSAVREVEALREVVENLERDLAALSSRYDALARGSRRELTGATEVNAESSGDRPDSATLEDALVALRDRLSTLENAEEIHLLAQSGKKKVAQKRLSSALGALRDSDAPAEDRLDAMHTLSGLRKQNYVDVATALQEQGLGEADLAWPMLEIAQDPGVEAELRGEALRSLSGMKTHEIRQPLMEIFASDDAVEVRTGAFDALAWHMSDSTVRRALRSAANDSQPEELRARATRLAPKFDHFDRRDAERSAAAARSGDARAAAGSSRVSEEK